MFKTPRPDRGPAHSWENSAKGGEPARGTKMESRIPMKRMGAADEVAEATLWLMSDKASYVTGSTLNVSGGR